MANWVMGRKDIGMSILIRKSIPACWKLDVTDSWKNPDVSSTLHCSNALSFLEELLGFLFNLLR